VTIRLASFDVFETCLLRDVLVPSEIFRRVAERIAGGDESKRDLSPDDFVQWRSQAEVRARERSEGEDVTLDEIWRELCAMLGWAAHPSHAELELAEEAASLQPVEAVRARVAAARASFGKVVFLSDSYLPGRFMRQQLQAHGLMAESDRLYLSSELGLTKATGNLFRHVLQQEGIAPAELVHHGDNDETDVRIPRRLGIRALRVDARALTRNERALFSGPIAGMRSVRDIAGASRQFRNTADPVERGAAELVGGFLGPFCGLFAAWALASAQRHGIERLYFCARDCQLVWRAARSLAPAFGGIDCRYLFVSRQALFLPSVERVDREDLHWLRRPFEKPLLAGILAKLELPAAVGMDHFAGLGAAGQDGLALDTPQQWEELWTRLEAPSLREAIRASAYERRLAATHYLRQEGLCDAITSGIVDIGWTLATQLSLGRILAAAGSATRLHGFYLQLNQARQAPAMAGAAESIFNEAAGDLKAAGALVSLEHRAHFLEHVVGLADHPRTVAYRLQAEGRASPQFADQPIAARDAASVQAVHRALDRYMQTHARSILSWARGDDDLRLVLHRLLESFFEHAGRPSVDCLSHLSIAADQNDHDARPLVAALSWRGALSAAFVWTPAGHAHADPLQPWPRAKRLVTPLSRLLVHDMFRVCRRLAARAWRGPVA
jgi:FMN phosphatase YigB (HAD superfamily)